MYNEQVLIVDDERNIVELIELYARQAGYRTRHAYDGQTGLDMAINEPPALMILDLMLPGLDGWEVCKRVRARSDVPIIMLTARDEDVDKIIGLELGADDYLTKPFNPRELMARVKAILRRVKNENNAHPGANATMRAGNLTIDRARRETLIAGKLVRLRTKEFDLLVTLLENKGIVFTREKLLETVWGFDFAGETRTVDVHVAQLRKRIAGSGVEIETVFGVGYKLTAI
ncbi:MAG: response regulator transcription factor [Chloroflexi bacterium]|nr:response regulator transcription factor [Chloroflexota bacterium]MCL5273900.1 response regulator transcription factor [Chloroflexota bacterium]